MGLGQEKTLASGSFKIVLHNTERSGGEMESLMAAAAGLADVLIIRTDDDEAFLKEAEDADAVIITYIKLAQERIARLHRCRVIAVQAIGVNNVDLDAAAEADIYVCNVPDYCIEEVAMHTIALMLDGTRKSWNRWVWRFTHTILLLRTVCLQKHLVNRR